ncbi:MAG: hypothetical protein LBE13_07335 [Bacteroidales bacterium]|jgi:hypothetical protein|nr:hypothetical protein [Bacteroidales bacterium]
MYWRIIEKLVVYTDSDEDQMKYLFKGISDKNDIVYIVIPMDYMSMSILERNGENVLEPIQNMMYGNVKEIDSDEPYFYYGKCTKQYYNSIKRLLQIGE